VFNKPVDPLADGCPDYFEIIKNPMDFGTIKERLDSNFYLFANQFKADVELVFYNCFLYNPDDLPITRICQ
jgi:hypothetical protein